MGLLLCLLAVVVAGSWAWLLLGDRSEAVSSPSTTSASTSSSSSTSEPAARSWSLADARQVVASPDARILVLGDETGDDVWEWVDLWARERGAPGALFVAGGEYSGADDETRVWSGSFAGATAAGALEDWDALWLSPDPDLVVMSYGRGYEDPEEVAPQLTTLRDKIATSAPEAPIVVVLQAAAQGDEDADVRGVVAEWAADAGLPTIDVAEAFTATNLPEAELLRDGVQPTERGNQLWADAVSGALEE